MLGGAGIRHLKPVAIRCDGERNADQQPRRDTQAGQHKEPVVVEELGTDYVDGRAGTTLVSAAEAG